MFKSIRWQLSLSYAAIALLAALALGAVLLSTLRSYYSGREVDYLRANAKAVGQFAMGGGAWTFPGPALQAQAQSLAFLVQAHVRLLDRDGRVLADSGSPGNAQYFSVSSFPPSAVASDVFTSTVAAPRPFVLLRTVSGSQSTLLPPGMSAETFTLKSGQAPTASTMLRSTVLYRNALGDEAAAGSARSSQVIRQALNDGAGGLAGYVELSEGPAYGGQIVESVARGWAMSGAIAVLLATLAGWLASRRISAPLQALAAATERMAAGDLAAHAPAGRHAPLELGLLTHSFNQMADQVQETVLALRRFVSDAAHELHTPLTALRTNLELAAAEDGVAHVQPLLERAQAQVQRLAQLTDSLLELSRIEAAVAGEGRDSTGLAALIQELVELEASRAEQAGLNFLLSLPDREVMVEGRQDRLCSLLTNLLDNAIKFTPAGGSVTLGVGLDGRWATVWVADTGIGIPAEDLAQLFSRFHRGRNTAGYPGNGLGLAIVKAIAESCGGSVCAEQADPGARFVVRLPLAAESG